MPSKLSQKFLDFANLVKAFIGTNYLTMPFAFHQAGIAIAVPLLAFIALITDHCCNLIVTCKRQIIAEIMSSLAEDHTLEETSSGNDVLDEIQMRLELNLKLGDIGKYCFGKVGLWLVNFCLFITQFGFGVNYFIFIGNTIYELFPLKNTSLPLPSTNYSYNLYPDALNEEDNLYRNERAAPLTVNEDVDVNRTTTLIANMTSLITTLPMTSTVTPTPEINGSVIDWSSMTGWMLTSTAPPLSYLVIMPLPIFILFSYVRNIRHMGSISVMANMAIFGGGFVILGFMISDFNLIDHIDLANLDTFPVFFGLCFSAFEGIGTIIPIEASMEGNRTSFSSYLHGALAWVTLALGAFGVLGYLRYGDFTRQIIIQNIPQHTPISIFVEVTLIIGVLCTYPLQVFPCVEMVEHFLFLKAYSKYRSIPNPTPDLIESNSVPQHEGHVCGPAADTRHLLDEGEQDYEEDEILPSDVEAEFGLPKAKPVPKEVAAWKRNSVRTLVVLVQLGVAVSMREKYAYFSSIMGAVGSSFLAYMLPTAVHVKLNRGRGQRTCSLLKDLFILFFGIVGSVLGLVVTIREIVSPIKI